MYDDVTTNSGMVLVRDNNLWSSFHVFVAILEHAQRS